MIKGLELGKHDVLHLKYTLTMRALRPGMANTLMLLLPHQQLIIASFLSHPNHPPYIETETLNISLLNPQLATTSELVLEHKTKPISLL